MNNKCRVCTEDPLNTKETPISIFLPIADQTTCTFADLITCFSVHINEMDELPKHICFKCATKLEEIFYFRQQIQSSDLYLKSICGNSDERVKTIKVEVDDVKKDVKGIGATMTDICLLCDDNLPTFSRVKEHMERHKDNSCERCNESFDSYRNLLAHFQTVHKPVKTENCQNQPLDVASTQSTISNPVKTFTCKQCDEEFPRKKLQVQHRLKYHPNKGVLERLYKCTLCAKSFVSNYKLSFHLASRHADSKLADRNAFKALTNRAQVHKACVICNEKFAFLKLLKRHLKEKHPVLKCVICEKVFKEASRLRRHVQSHNGKRSFKCTECDYSSKDQGTLTNHMLTHTKTKRFKCDVCDLAFYHNYRLKKHKVAAHSDQKNYACEFCGRAFSIKDKLQNHLRKHTMKYECGVCFKKRPDMVALQRHIEQEHSDIDLHKCPYCYKVFKNARSVLSHERGVHRPKTLTIVEADKCEVCGDWMPANKLKSHIINTH